MNVQKALPQSEINDFVFLIHLFLKNSSVLMEKFESSFKDEMAENYFDKFQEIHPSSIPFPPSQHSFPNYCVIEILKLIHYESSSSWLGGMMRKELVLLKRKWNQFFHNFTKSNQLTLPATSEIDEIIIIFSWSSSHLSVDLSSSTKSYIKIHRIHIKVRELCRCHVFSLKLCLLCVEILLTRSFSSSS